MHVAVTCILWSSVDGNTFTPHVMQIHGRGRRSTVWGRFRTVVSPMYPASTGTKCISMEVVAKLASCAFASWGWGVGAVGRGASEGEGPQRRLQKPFDRRLEEVAKAVGAGHRRLEMPLSLAFAVRETRPGGRGGGACPPPHPSDASLGWVRCQAACVRRARTCSNAPRCGGSSECCRIRNTCTAKRCTQTSAPLFLC